jgi:hypothetical protein
VLGPISAGVRILVPDDMATPLPKRGKTDVELVVDGDIVDLNRIPLPAETSVIDKRFE